MPQKIVVSIYSRKKRRVKKLLPAVERYQGTHIAFVATIARNEGHLPFFILSGKFGLLAEREVVGWYNYLLTEPDVPSLVKRLARQLSVARIREIRFYTKNKPNWKPYRDALEGAAAKVGAKVIVHELPDDA